MTMVPVDPQRPAWIELVGPAGELAQKIAETEFVPMRLRKRPAAVMACILSGQEAGVGPMQALRQIFVTDDGKVGMAAELMRSLVLREGHEIWPEDYTTTRVTMAGRRRGQGDANPTRVTWTMDDAKKAGLLSRKNWQGYPRAMLTARATTELCRLVFPDVIAGISYSLEELEDGDTDLPPGEPLATDEAKKTVTRKAAPARPRKTAVPRPAAPEPDLPGDPSPNPAADWMANDQKIAMRAREARLDHHIVIAAVTSGTKKSAKDLDGAEAAAVLEAIKDLAAGRKRLIAEEGQWPYLEEIDPVDQADDIEDAEVVDDGPLLPDEIPPLALPPFAEWGADEWRLFLADRGVKVADVLREAHRLAPLHETVPPVSLEQLAQRKRLGQAIHDYVDAFSREAAS